MIFDEKIRTDSSPKRHGERDFNFFNRSARPEISRVRVLLESFAANYPHDQLEELVSRIRSGNDTHFKSATFELTLFAVLTRAGAALEIHPQVANGAHPDFLVTCPDGSRFYLEAVLASEKSWTNEPAEARKSGVMNVLSAARHPNFWIDITSEGDPTTQPGGAQLLARTLQWLDGLDVEDISEKINASGFDDLPEYRWQHEDWKLTLKPVPVSPVNRGKTTTLVGAYSAGAGWVNAWEPIANAVKYKGNRYGNLTAPFLVAVNVDSFHLDKIDEVQGLFGQEQYVISSTNPSAEPRMDRARNGAWWGANGPQYRRVSGVWLFNDLGPSTIAVRRQSIYFNPWATYPLPSWLENFPHTKGIDGLLQETEGTSFSTVLNLPDDWPR
jgi:hypothetical protein